MAEDQRGNGRLPERRVGAAGSAPAGRVTRALRPSFALQRVGPFVVRCGDMNLRHLRLAIDFHRLGLQHDQ